MAGVGNSGISRTTSNSSKTCPRNIYLLIFEINKIKTIKWLRRYLLPFDSLFLLSFYKNRLNLKQKSLVTQITLGVFWFLFFFDKEDVHIEMRIGPYRRTKGPVKSPLKENHHKNAVFRETWFFGQSSLERRFRRREVIYWYRRRAHLVFIYFFTTR